jgi:hypothetical protein
MLRAVALAALLISLAAMLADGVVSALDRDCCAAAQLGSDCEPGCAACLHCTQVPTALPDRPHTWQSVLVVPGAEPRSAADPEPIAAAGVFHPPRSAAR